jgi:hypothetical protein
MSKGWQKAWVVVALLFVSLVGREVIKTSRTDAVIGEVHHQRQRQIDAGLSIFNGLSGRLTANKYLLAGEVVTQRLLEAIDPNIIFFAGHPNERVGITETNRVPWVYIPLFTWGVITIVNSDSKKFKIRMLAFFIVAISWVIRFKQVENKALIGMTVWVWGVTTLGFVDLLKRAFRWKRNTK